MATSSPQSCRLTQPPARVPQSCLSSASPQAPALLPGHQGTAASGVVLGARRLATRRRWLTTSKKSQLLPKELAGTYLMEEVGDCQVIVIEKNLLLCSEKPFPDGQACSRHCRGVVLHVEFVGEFVGRQLAHCKKHRTPRSARDTEVAGLSTCFCSAGPQGSLSVGPGTQTGINSLEIQLLPADGGGCGCCPTATHVAGQGTS